MDISSRRFRFLEFLLDCGTRKLTSREIIVPLTPKEFATLVCLVKADGQAVARDTIMMAVWPDTTVGDTSLARNISVLRRHLGTSTIESVPRFGYRFVPQVIADESEPVADSITPKPLPLLLPYAPRLAPVNAAPDVVPEAAATLDAVSLPVASDADRVTDAAGDAPPAVAQAVRQRFKLGGLLGWSALAAMLFTVLALTSSLLRRQTRLAGARTEPALPVAPLRLAVLPFRNLSPNPAASDYLRDGLVDDLTVRLGAFDYPHLRVLARTSAAQYAGTSKTPAVIGAELGAQYLLEGSVDFREGTTHLLISLVDVRDQTIRWSEEFDGPVEELFAEEAAIIHKVAVSPVLSEATQPHPAGGTSKTVLAAARDEYLRGRFQMNLATAAAFEQALLHFERAAELDGSYAEAYAGIADAYIHRTDTLPLTFCYRRAREATATALRLDPGLAEAHRNLAYLDQSEHNDLDSAEREYREAIRLAPQDVKAHYWYANMLMAQRRTRDALEQARAAFDLDPRSVRSIATYGFLLAEGDDAAAGVEKLNAALQLDPANEMTWGYLGIGYLRLHRYTEAASAFDRAANYGRFSASYLADAAYTRAKAGDPQPARKLYRTLSGRAAHHQWVPAQAMAMTTLALGNKAEAEQWLRKGLDDHTITLFELNNDPLHAEISGNPHILSLLAAAGSRTEEASLK